MNKDAISENYPRMTAIAVRAIQAFKDRLDQEMAAQMAELVFSKSTPTVIDGTGWAEAAFPDVVIRPGYTVDSVTARLGWPTDGQQRLSGLYFPAERVAKEAQAMRDGLAQAVKLDG